MTRWRLAVRSTRSVDRQRSRVVSSPDAPRRAKLLENIFRAVNIALVNELKLVCDAHGHRRLGGDRRGEDQAVRLHAVLSRARASAATASRSIRSTSPGRRASTASSRASSSSPARSTSSMPATSSIAIAEALNTARQAAQGLAHPRARRRLQDATSTTCASRPRSTSSRPPRARRGRDLPRPVRAELPRLRLSSAPLGDLYRARPRLVVIVTADFRDRLRHRSSIRPRSSSTSAASTDESERHGRRSGSSDRGPLSATSSLSMSDRRESSN